MMNSVPPEKVSVDWLNSTALEIATRYGYPIPTCKIVPKDKPWAACNRRTLTIQFSYKFISEQPEEVVIALIKHEICHLKHRNHTDMFEQACKEMGIKKHTWMMFQIVPVHHHPYECPNCGKIYWRKEMYVRNHSCYKCNPNFDKRFILVYKGHEIYKKEHEQVLFIH